MPLSPRALDALTELERILQLAGSRVQTRVVREVDCRGTPLPVYAIALGNPDQQVPAIGFFGGVHGLERIGAEVVIAYLHSIVMRLTWDHTLHRQLESLRLVFMPLVNPGGMALGTRANPRGVDLMRNAPVDALEPVPALVGGQRLSARLPWYRGRAGAPMEEENQAVCEVVAQELLPRPFSMSVDCHSGFGVQDRLWFPFAHTRQALHHLAEMYALQVIFRQTYNHHPYVFEPQSLQYLAHGDLWDHLYLQSRAAPERVFLPLTLEMGSWLWIKKNPRQLFSRHGIFNPLIGHRQERVLRRHLWMLDFLTRAACSAESWVPQDNQRHALHAEALQHWY
nr:M14 family zinc carboxypeptidase [uncultured Rhodoferax sp.]